MDAPFNRGLAWYRYKCLEEEFISATKYFPLEKAHKAVWSEFFGDLLIKACNSIDSFFRNMLKDTTDCLGSYHHVAKLEASRRKKDMNYFRDFFDEIYALSGAKVDIAYGLTFYDKEFCPFGEFAEGKVPAWWTAYNHVKHTWFDSIEEATLEAIISALSGLFILNVLNTSSRLYLLKYQNVISWEYMNGASEDLRIQFMGSSKIGIPKELKNYHITASTPIFVHTYRVDQNSSLKNFRG